MKRVESRQLRVERPRHTQSQRSTVDCELPSTEGFATRDLIEAKALLEEL